MTVGKAIPYIDSVDRVTGHIDYVLNMELPNMLHAKVLRSPYPHAKIVQIDTSSAEKIPGVVAVLKEIGRASCRERV